MRPLFLLLLSCLAGPALGQAGSPAMPPTPSSSLQAYALRLRPGDDLRQQLLAFVAAHRMEAGAVLTCVGSLTSVRLRLANQEAATLYQGHFEIVSLVGTLAASGGGHLHLSVSDSTGRTLGGHLLDGCRVYTTAEIVLAALPGLIFTRETDSTFGYQELVIKPAPARIPKKR
ncbi:PPC domain-containing DNA-binding protein [Hymenobacter psoromatis]|uniref:PPC domain-containing DNA-binding protein n=1 Tax=Hymenobacter psoromatis TaxID=1484116 RepID=UPI001CC0435D|nr:PPC domain-containing DNA-binding protein [Hymenobacter psoromatis]